MDKDQSKRKNLRAADPTFKDPDYYEFESESRLDLPLQRADIYGEAAFA